MRGLVMLEYNWHIQMIKKAKVQKKSWIREKAKVVFLAKFFKESLNHIIKNIINTKFLNILSQ